MYVGLVCFICGFVVSFVILSLKNLCKIAYSKVSVLVAMFYRDIDLVAKKAGRKQYFLVTRCEKK